MAGCTGSTPGADDARRRSRPEGPWRYADLRFDARRRRFLAVREDHARRPDEPRSRAAIVAVPARRPEPPTVLRERARLPRRSAAVARTAAASPGSSGTTRTCPGTPRACGSPGPAPDGTLGDPVLVAGGPDESIAQPEWSADGDLHFVSDRSGWWNLYRLAGGPALDAAGADGGRVRRSRPGSSGAPRTPSRRRLDRGGRPARRPRPAVPHRARRQLSRRGRDRRTPSSRASSPEPPGDRDALRRARPSPRSWPGSTRRRSARGRHPPARRAGLVLDPGTRLDRRSRSSSRPRGGRTAHALYYPPRNPALRRARRRAAAARRHVPRRPDRPTRRRRSIWPSSFLTSRGIAVVDVDYGGSTGYGRAYRRDARRQLGHRRRRRLRGRGRNSSRARRRRPGAAGDPRRQRRRLHDARRARVPRRFRGRDQPLRRRRSRDPCRATRTSSSRATSTGWSGRTRRGSRATASARRSTPSTGSRARCSSSRVSTTRSCRPSQAEAIVAALAANGIPHAYLAFEGEGHGFRGAVAIRRSLEAELSFLGQVFGFEPADPTRADRAARPRWRWQVLTEPRPGSTPPMAALAPAARDRARPDRARPRPARRRDRASPTSRAGSVIPYPILLVLGGARAGPRARPAGHASSSPSSCSSSSCHRSSSAPGSGRRSATSRPTCARSLLLAVGLVLFTTVVVAGSSPGARPRDRLAAAAFALGAIVAPPDAVAATAIFQRLGVPPRIVTILEGESLINDASALIAYRFAVAAAARDAFSVAEARASFVFVACGGIAVGVVVGLLVTESWRRTADPILEIIVSLLAPVTAYLAGRAARGGRASSLPWSPGSSPAGRAARVLSPDGAPHGPRRLGHRHVPHQWLRVHPHRAPAAGRSLDAPGRPTAELLGHRRSS